MRALFMSGLLMTLPLGAASMQGPKEQMKVLPTGPKIRVLLEKDIPSSFLEVRGPYRVIRKDGGSLLSSGNSGKRFVVHAIQDGLRWGEEYLDVYQITVVPTDPKTVMYLDGIQYKGAISVYHVRDNKITVVNEVPIEDYLKSTLAIQYVEPLHREALCALAITARTLAYACALHGKSSSRPWEIVAKEVNYFGHGVTEQRKGIEEAVEWTRYMVMESPQTGGPLQNIHLAPTKAQELARSGYDAKKILQSSFPHQKLGITISADEVAIK